jgi:catechol 2,3-dioxygenase
MPKNNSIVINIKVDQNHLSSSSSPKEQFSVGSGMSMGPVSLAVSDLNKSVDFYKSVLGFKTIGKVLDDRALLGASSRDSLYLLELLQVKSPHDIDSNKVDISEVDVTNRRRAGLYHFAILLPERKFLADMLQNLSNKRDQVYFDGLADHLVSESIYIRDPDFNGIEIYRDRPTSEWNWRRNYVEMATLPLDTGDLLKESTVDGWNEMPVKTTIGHVHLHVSDTEKARQFYQEILGLQLTARIPNALFFAADRYHHHVATNTWLGTGIAKAMPGSVGLNYFTIRLSNKEEFAKLLDRIAHRNIVLARTDSSESSVAVVHDADGIEIRLQCEQSK